MQKNIHFSDSNVCLSYFDLNTKYKQIESNNGYNPYASLIIGKWGVGKTFLTKNIISELNKIHNFETTILVSYDKSMNEFENINECININLYTRTNLKYIIEKQKSQDSKPILIIFDDCIFSKVINNNNNFKEILINGKHLKICSIVVVQYPISFNQEIRENFDFVYYYKDECIANSKKIYKQYFGILPSYSQFDIVVNSLINYECLVLDNFCNSFNINDKLGLYKTI